MFNHASRSGTQSYLFSYTVKLICCFRIRMILSEVKMKLGRGLPGEQIQKEEVGSGIWKSVTRDPQDLHCACHQS
jgi:hypothetical protein